MPAFRFRLASVLKLREAVRSQRQSELAEVHLAQQKLHTRRQTLEDELRELAQVCRQSTQPGAVDVDRLIEVNRYEALLRVETQQLTVQEAQLAVQIEHNRQALVEADREVRVLEKLREKKHQQHSQTVAAAEIKQIDDAASRQTAKPARV